MTDTIPSTLRMLRDRDPDRIGYGQGRDIRKRPKVKAADSGWFGYLKPGYTILGNVTNNSYTGGFPNSLYGTTPVTPVSGESSIDEAGYGYNYPMQFWPSRNQTAQPLGYVTPDKTSKSSIASIRFRPQLRTLNFEPSYADGWWGYEDPVKAPLQALGAMALRRDANPQFLLGYKDKAYGEYNRYRSRHTMPCTGGRFGQVTCLPCLREFTGDRIQQNIQNSVTGLNTQCQALTSPIMKQNTLIPQAWKDVMKKEGVAWKDGKPDNIDNLKVQDLFPCPMPDFVHRLGPANIPHDVMSSLGVTDVQDEEGLLDNVSSWGYYSYANFLTSSNTPKPYQGGVLSNGRPAPWSYDQRGKDTPEANFYTCEYRSGAVDSIDNLKKFLEYVENGEVAPCCGTSETSCTYVPGNATIPFLQGMPDDFAANLMSNFEVNVASKGKYCQSELDEMLGVINDALNSVTIRSGNHGKLRTSLLNLRTTLLSRTGVEEADCPRFQKYRQCETGKQAFIDNLITLAQSDGSCQDFNEPCANLNKKPGSTCRTFQECLDERLRDEVELDCGVDCELEPFGPETKCALGPDATEEISQLRVFKRIVAKMGPVIGKVYRTAKVKRRGTKGNGESQGKLCSAFGEEVQGTDGFWYVRTSAPCTANTNTCANTVRDLGVPPPNFTGPQGRMMDNRCVLEEMPPDCPRVDCRIQWNVLPADEVNRKCVFKMTEQRWDQSGWDGFLTGVTEYKETGTLTKPQCGGTGCAEARGYRVLSDQGDTQSVERTIECPLTSFGNLDPKDAAIPNWQVFPNAHRNATDCACNGGIWDNNRCRVQNTSFSGTTTLGSLKRATDPECKSAFSPTHKGTGLGFTWHPNMYRKYNQRDVFPSEGQETLGYQTDKNFFYWNLERRNSAPESDPGPWVWDTPPRYSTGNPGPGQYKFNGVTPERIAGFPESSTKFTNLSGKLYWQYCRGDPRTQGSKGFVRFERPGSMNFRVPPMGPVIMTPNEKAAFVEVSQIPAVANLINPITGRRLFPIGTIDKARDQYIQVDFQDGVKSPVRYCVAAVPPKDGNGNAPWWWPSNPNNTDAENHLTQRNQHIGQDGAFCGYFRIPRDATCDQFVNFRN